MNVFGIEGRFATQCFLQSIPGSVPPLCKDYQRNLSRLAFQHVWRHLIDIRMSLVSRYLSD